MIAMLDWELSTLGHPLADLAYNCMRYHIVNPLDRDSGRRGLRCAQEFRAKRSTCAKYCRTHRTRRHRPVGVLRSVLDVPPGFDQPRCLQARPRRQRELDRSDALQRDLPAARRYGLEHPRNRAPHLNRVTARIAASFSGRPAATIQVVRVAAIPTGTGDAG